MESNRNVWYLIHCSTILHMWQNWWVPRAKYQRSKRSLSMFWLTVQDTSRVRLWLSSPFCTSFVIILCQTIRHLIHLISLDGITRIDKSALNFSRVIVSTWLKRLLLVKFLFEDLVIILLSPNCLKIKWKILSVVILRWPQNDVVFLFFDRYN